MAAQPACALRQQQQQPAQAVPWRDRLLCQSHIALLACLHQQQEDDPAAAAVHARVVADERALLVAGLLRLPGG
jgi:hypothetical protein